MIFRLKMSRKWIYHYRVIGGAIQSNLGERYLLGHDLIGLGVDIRGIFTSADEVINGTELTKRLLKAYDTA